MDTAPTIHIGTLPHAIDRAKERYGVSLTMRDLNAMQRACAEGKALLLDRLAGGVEKRLVRHDDGSGRLIPMAAAYDPATGYIVTFLHLKLARHAASLPPKAKKRLHVRGGKKFKRRHHRPERDEVNDE